MRLRELSMFGAQLMNSNVNGEAEGKRFGCEK